MLPNAHVGQTNANHTADNMSSDEDVEPDDIHHETSVDGSSRTVTTTCYSNSNDFLSTQKENWVTSVAALHNTDLVVSGKKFC